MRPMGMKPVRFPGKEDVHPPQGYVNWWENEFDNRENKKAERQEGKRQCRDILHGELWLADPAIFP